jgi:hypothetical protein
MNTETDLEAIAKSIIDSNVYMTLGTADEDGQPWGLARVLRIKWI